MTTLHMPIDEELHKQLRIYAAMNGISLKELVTRTLAAMLVEEA